MQLPFGARPGPPPTAAAPTPGRVRPPVAQDGRRRSGKVDADVLGVNEIENDGYGADSAIAHLVDRLNAATGAGHLRLHRRRCRDRPDQRPRHRRHQGRHALQAGHGDARSGRPRRSTPWSSSTVATTAPRSRPSLAQAFQGQRDRRRLRRRRQPPQVQGLGVHRRPTPVTARATATRRAPARPRRSRPGWPGDPTGTGEQDVLILGDLNSYAKEDPIVGLETAGLHQPRRAASSVRTPTPTSFDGQWGYLDHALGVAVVARQVTGVRSTTSTPTSRRSSTTTPTSSRRRRSSRSTRRTSSASPTTTRSSSASRRTRRPRSRRRSRTPRCRAVTGNASLTVGITDRDADDTHTATIAWGDGTSETVVDPASSPLTRTHTYAAAGRYTATVTVTDSHGHVTTATAAGRRWSTPRAGCCRRSGPADGKRLDRAGQGRLTPTATARCRPTSAPVVTVTQGGTTLAHGHRDPRQG